MSRRDWDDPERMLSVDDAFERIVGSFRALESTILPILDALGLVLSEDVVAGVNVPPFRNSAMDGYALRARDTAGASYASPTFLDVIETVAAGAAPRQMIAEAQAARIMTGAPLPEGADAVVRFEETDEAEHTVSSSSIHRVAVRRAMAANENVRAAGEDLPAGECALRAGTILGPVEIGVLAALNIGAVAVHRRPRVAILSTGDELRDIGAPLAHGQIHDSNSYALYAMVKRLGGEPVRLGVARDSTTDLAQSLRSIRDIDLLVTSGGVSHGDYDVVKDVLRAEGEIELWEVRMKPGKPLAFGRIGGIPLLGLPGNPAAAFVSFMQFGRPAILKMLGHTRIGLPEVDAKLAERIRNRGGRRHFQRGIISSGTGGFEVRTTGIHGSAMLSALVSANCLIVVPEDRTTVEAGEVVRVQLLDDALAVLTGPEIHRPAPAGSGRRRRS
jgi:molybdopterin molybdotransferase